MCKGGTEMTEATTQISSSIDALTREFEIITHNLANASTVGFKRRCNAFSKALDAQQGGAETYAPGTIDLDSAFDFSQGSLVQTDRTLDFALMGRGFFVVETPDGPLYTRNGAFGTNANGQIVDSMGRPVAGEAGPITVPATVGLSEIQAFADGRLSAGGINIGKIKVVDFKDNESKLVPAGGNCLVMPDKSIQPAAAEKAIVKQGCQEASNVRVVDELVDMIMVTRLYEANMKYISAQGETSSSIINVAMG
jgi:flagellar basal body rod protein FlgG